VRPARAAQRFLFYIKEAIEMLPKDPMILLSVVNTKLRDEYDSLAALCDDLGEDEDALRAVLAAAGGRIASTAAAMDLLAAVAHPPGGPAPADVTAVAERGDLKVTWKAAGDRAEGYRVYFRSQE